MQMKKAFASDILGKAEYAIIIMITERANNAMSVEALILSIYIFLIVVIIQEETKACYA